MIGSDLILAAVVEAMHAPDPAPVVAAGVSGPREPRPSRAQVSRVVGAASVLPGRWGAFQRCVEHRESKGSPTVVNASGHAGIYQFAIGWRHGLPYIVQRGLVAHGMTRRDARTIRLALPTRIEQWPAKYQRVGFAQVIREGGRAAALRHWGLAGSVCQGLVR